MGFQATTRPRRYSRKLAAALQASFVAALMAGCSTSSNMSVQSGSPASYGPVGHVASAARPARGRVTLAEFDNGPFPYRGDIPDKGVPFLDVNEGGRLGHTSGRAGVHWEDETFSDQRSLIYIPRGFDPSRPALMVVFFHGNGATLQRDIAARQGIPRQVAESGLNAVLVAPQFAVDARDSSAGKFWQPGGFAAYLDEASLRLAQVYGDEGMRSTFAQMPVVLVAYSGGYYPAAYSLTLGGANNRIAGVALYDALYHEEDKFAAWIAQRSGFFFSTYAESTRGHNIAFEKKLSEQSVAFDTSLPDRLAAGTVAFLDSGDVEHQDFMTHAWADDPLKKLLVRIPGYGGAIVAQTQ